MRLSDTPDPIRTGDLLLRRQLLYPAELPGRGYTAMPYAQDYGILNSPVNPVRTVVGWWRRAGVGDRVGVWVTICGRGRPFWGACRVGRRIGR